MIIACPACATRYVVPDSAIGIDGRTVRCAKCKHSWFQDGPDVERLVSAENVTTAPCGFVVCEEMLSGGVTTGSVMSSSL